MCTHGYVVIMKTNEQKKYSAKKTETIIANREKKWYRNKLGDEHSRMVKNEIIYIKERDNDDDDNKNKNNKRVKN